MKRKQRRMDKKAGDNDLWHIMITCIVLIFLIWAFVSQYSALQKIKVPIGKRQADVLIAYQEGERAMQYLDTAASLASYSALYKNGRIGGYASLADNPCGSYAGYAIYISDKDECVPDNETINAQLGKSVQKELNLYLANNPFDIPQLTYTQIIPEQSSQAGSPLIIRGYTSDFFSIPIDGYPRNFYIDAASIETTISYSGGVDPFAASQPATTSASMQGDLPSSYSSQKPASIDWDDLKDVDTKEEFLNAVGSGRLVSMEGIPHVSYSQDVSPTCNGVKIEKMNRYGRPSLRPYLTALAQEFYNEFGKDLDLNDVFAPRGCEHKSHYRGIAFDMGYDVGDPKGEWVVKTTKAWCPGANIFFNDQALIAAGYTKFATGHTNHVHIDYYCDGVVPKQQGVIS